MKILRIALVALVLLALAGAAYVFSHALYPERAVGLQLVAVPVPQSSPMTVAIWYPTDTRPLPTTLAGVNLLSVAKNGSVAGRALPLVVISHGNGGGPWSHVDLALALAQKGFVVAAPMHPGDNFADQSALASPRWLVDRTRHVGAAIDYLLGTWPSHDRIDAKRVGVFGFSAGGFSVLGAIGGKPDLGRVPSYCKQADEFVCKLLASSHSPMLTPGQAPAATDFNGDPRIKAAVVVAPGLGFTFAPGGLADVHIPVQLWTGDADRNVPTASNAKPVRDAMGPAVDYHELPGASHFSFLAPCGLFGPPMLCRDADGFDRERVHRDMNEAIATFFSRSI